MQSENVPYSTRISSKRVPKILQSLTSAVIELCITHEINHTWNVCLWFKTLVCPHMTLFFQEILIFLLESNGISGYGRYYCHLCFVRTKLVKFHNPSQSRMKGGTKERERGTMSAWLPLRNSRCVTCIIHS